MFQRNGQPFPLPTGGYGIGADGKIYPTGCPAGVDGINYPAATGPLFSAEGRAEMGIIDVPTEQLQRPDERFFLVTDNGAGGLAVEPRDLGELRKAAIEAVKTQRQTALDVFVKSPGVKSIYDENFEAARQHLAGAGSAFRLRTGQTASEYLAAKGASMGRTADEFAAYIIGENAAAAVKASEIEDEYLRLAYAFIPTCSFDQVQTVADDFRDYCAARTAG